ncbi:phenylacetate--CoA ligase family protein [Streptomyces avidinii]|uniref:Phenylacetate-CoA ligase n=1 Tax=Streptomyces avidinii TaxID=1895 RepID=A0ABS4LHC3_STRAV|nr:phenylacetate--CoA ligase family protein [Streptomyces avidinii]MBP2041510.1 phenylacetate-CoA ligase [Streptomyces avidinii]GGZ34474.1 AMP-binding protein [Streptomyces avidinii]
MTSATTARHEVPAGVTDADRLRLLRTTLVQAAKSPYYAPVLGGLGAEALREADFDLLQRLPFTDKEQLREAGLRVLSVPLAETVRYYESSGTTGTPTPTPKTKKDIAANTRGLLLNWRRILRPREDKAILLVPSDIAPVADAMVYGLEAMDVFSVRAFPFTRGVSGWDQIVRICRETGITTVLTTPGLSLHFYAELKTRGLDPTAFGIRTVLLLGELLTEPMRAMLERLWNAQVYINSYGSSEMGTCSTSCPEKRMHLLEHMYHFEWVDPQTGAPTTAETAELVVTTLTADARPLLRYRTGDLVRRVSGDCACGLALPMVEVLGRVTDELEIAGRRLRPYDVEEIVYAIPGLLGYCIRFEDDGRPLLCLEVERDHQDPASCAEITRLAEEALLVRDLPLEVELSFDFNELTKRGGGFKNWKLTHVVRN